MVNLQIKETDINKAKSWSEAVYLDDDLLLTEHINKAPMPTEPRKMNFILIGLCTKGRIAYQVDTQEQIINPGDILIVSERHIVDHYQPSPDMEGLCMILSVNFFHEIIQNVRDVNSLFLFARNHPVISLTQKEQDTFKEYFQVIKQKIGDKENYFHKDLIRTLLLAMFYDVGNVWEDAWDFDPGDLASSWGVGFRLDFVGFPIRLDYAMPIDKPDDWVRSRRFVFWIGFDN